MNPARPCLPAVLAMLALAAPPALAVELTVSNLNDAGAGSLRAALAALPADQHNRITITAPFGILQLQSPLPALRGLSVEIVGNFQIIDGGGQHAMFVGNLPTTLRRLHLRAGARSSGGCLSVVGATEFDRMQFEACRAGLGGSNAYGGAASVSGNLVVRASAFRDNLAQATLGGGNGAGGGLDHSGGSLLIEDSLFEANTVSPGPAIFALGGAVNSTRSSVLIRRSRFLGNRSLGSEGAGGALQFSALDSVRIEGSYFGGNSSEGGGGAVTLLDAPLWIENTSLYANESRFGGALYLVETTNPGSASLRLRASALHRNRSLNAGFAQQGGHLATNGAVRIDEISNSAFAAVEAGTACLFLGAAPGYAGPGFNRSADASCLAVLGNDSAQIAASAFGFAPPMFSGRVETLRPARDSALINAGSPAVTGDAVGACPVDDADGRARPRPGVFGAPNRCDIGAVEFDEALFRDGFESQ